MRLGAFSINDLLRSAVRGLTLIAALAAIGAADARAQMPPDLFLPYSERYFHSTDASERASLPAQLERELARYFPPGASYGDFGAYANRIGAVCLNQYPPESDDENRGYCIYNYIGTKRAHPLTIRQVLITWGIQMRWAEKSGGIKELTIRVSEIAIPTP